MEYENEPYRYKRHTQPASNVWWDDEESKQVLYGPKGEVLVSKTNRRRIGYFKDGY